MKTNNTKQITVGTMGRCGSTVLTNIIKAIFQISDIKYKFISQEFSKNQCAPVSKNNVNEDFLILKAHYNVHNYAKDSDYTFTCMRDIREMMSSTKKYLKKINYKQEYTKDNIFDECKNQLEIYESWEKYSDYCFKYEDYVKDFDKYSKKICDILEIDYVDGNKIKEIVENNVKTHHITSKDIGVKEYLNILSEVEIKIIENNFKDFLLSNDYKIKKRK